MSQDLSYLAGVLAHRGSIGFNVMGTDKCGRAYRYLYPSIRLTTNDENLAKGLKATFGGSAYPNGNSWTWRLACRQAETAARALIPYMINPKRVKALESIIDWYRYIPDPRIRL